MFGWIRVEPTTYVNTFDQRTNTALLGQEKICSLNICIKPNNRCHISALSFHIDPRDPTRHSCAVLVALISGSCLFVPVIQ